MSTRKYTQLQLVQAWNNYCEATGRLDDRIYKGLDNMSNHHKMCLELINLTETLGAFMRRFGGAK